MKVINAEQLGAVVRNRRKKLMLSQAELAQRIGGVSRQWVVAVEAGKANPDFETLVRTADALQMNLELRTGFEVRPSIGAPDLDEIIRSLKK